MDFSVDVLCERKLCCSFPDCVLYSCVSSESLKSGHSYRIDMNKISYWNRLTCERFGVRYLFLGPVSIYLSVCLLFIAKLFDRSEAESDLIKRHLLAQLLVLRLFTLKLP